MRKSYFATAIRRILSKRFFAHVSPIAASPHRLVYYRKAKFRQTYTNLILKYMNLVFDPREE